jgi:putative MATE family efflux protein
LRLALPVLASQVLRLAYQWVDALWVRSLGVEATAAVTTSMFVMWWVYALNDIVATGVVAYVAQLLGAGDRPRAGVAASKALAGSALLGLPAVALGLWGARGLYRLLGGDAAVVEQGGAYLGVVLAFAPVPMMAMSCEGIMRGSGDTRTPLLIDLAAVSLNAALDPLLIFGLGPFPRMGVAGAAWATVIAQGVMLASYLTQAARRHPAFPLQRRAPGDAVRVVGLLRVGIPVALIGALFSVVYLGLTRVASDFGAAAMAVVGLVNRVEAMTFVLCFSIGGAAAVLVGQNLGAGRPDRAERAVRVGVRWALWIAAAIMAGMLLAPGAFVGLFTQDLEAHRLGVPYLRVIALAAIADAVEIVTAEAIVGSGRMLAISNIYTAFSLVRIPAAAALAHWTPLGFQGIPWTLSLTCIGRSALIWWWFVRGTWKRGLGGEVRPAGDRPA